MGDDLPHAVEAEQALLGALLQRSDLFDRVVDRVDGEDFAVPCHAALYHEINRRLAEGARSVNPIVLREWAESDPDVGPAGGFAYLMRLVQGVVTLYVEDYARQIRSTAERRRLILAAQEIADRARHDEDAEAVRAFADSALLASGGPSADRGILSWDDAADEAVREFEAAYQNGGRITGLSWSFVGLDNLLGGLQPGDLVVLGARPAMGKTSFGTRIAVEAARQGQRVGFCSLEMPARQLANRVISAAAGVSPSASRTGRINAADAEAFVCTQQELRGMPVSFVHGRTTAAQHRAFRRVKMRHGGLGLVIVDYLGLIAAGEGQASKSPVQEVAAITRALKLMAQSLEVRVILLCQLNRGVEHREDKRPTLADLRDSGAIEQDADAVLFLFREEYYLKNAEPKQRPEEDDAKFSERMSRYLRRLQEVEGEAEVIVAKSRHGGTGTVRVCFDADRAQFEDPAGPVSWRAA